ncbi:MAG: GNAT family N-acetyltransferase [Candidatus Kapabacteria bacterium]|jgi:GNAT superfamily N-acetyltransferase|nr:GNAT family N-acetyltransferase [Candidatus Kapabacteria bacterium]
MISYIRTNSDNADFQALVQQLDQHLRAINGEEQAFFTQFNATNQLRHVIVAYYEGIPVGCGAMKPYSETIGEIKRMFVREEYRGKGIAQGILAALEMYAKETGCTSCVLETSRHLVSAINLYKNSGYEQIPNYGQYEGVEMSICFQKNLV